jgi:hypothetical protein
MEQHVRVELVPRMVPVDEVTQAERAETVQRLAELGQIDPSQGQIADLMQDGWLARINGAEFPVSDYGVGPIEGSTQALVSLLVPADSLQVGDPSTAVQEPQVSPATPEPKRASSWGAPGPDPREGIPGWTPPTDEPVKVEFVSGDSNRLVSSVRESIRRAYPSGTAYPGGTSEALG